MKIKIIDPAVNISDFQIERWGKYLKKYLRPETVIEFETIPRGFPAVETETQGLINGAETVRLIRSINREGGWDGIFVNCFDEPGVLAGREFSAIPVLGPYQPSMLFASMLAEKFAVVSTDSYGVMCERRKSRLLGLTPGRIQNAGLGVLELSDEERLLGRLLECCRELSCEQYGAVILGCTGMAGIIDPLKALLHEQGINIEVVEPLRTGVTALENMLVLGHKNLIQATRIGEFP